MLMSPLDPGSGAKVPTLIASRLCAVTAVWYAAHRLAAERGPIRRGEEASVPTMAAARISPPPPHRAPCIAAVAVTTCLALGGCGGANGPWARDGGVKAPPPIAEVRERPARQAAARPGPARWQLRPSDDGRGCRLTADAPGGTVTLLGGAGTEPETTPRIVLRIAGAGPQRFQPGRDYALRAANAGSALPLAVLGEREAAARVPTAEGGDGRRSPTS